MPNYAEIPESMEKLIELSQPRSLKPFVMSLSELAASDIPPREFLLGAPLGSPYRELFNRVWGGSGSCKRW